jgi:hypothetical protein
VTAQLSITVPKGWSPVDLERAFSESVPDLMIAVLEEELDGEDQNALREEFGRVREEVRDERIAFMALRLAEDGSRRDVMTVAVHERGSALVTAESTPAQPTAAPAKATAETVERVSVESRDAIVHVSADAGDVLGGPNGSPSWVQVVLLFSSEEGAAVTLTSSAAGRQEELRAEAIEVAGSLALVPDAPVEA